MTDTKRMIKVYQQQGWYPAKWAHHPQPIKDAIRLSYRPQIKLCYANCQRLMLSRLPIVGDLEYHEGYIVTLIAMPHAWLVWRGQTIELTLPPDREVEYMRSNVYSVQEIRSAIVRDRCYGPVDPQALRDIHPWFPPETKQILDLLEIAASTQPTPTGDPTQ